MFTGNSNPMNSFGEQQGEFKFTREEANQAFSRNIGKGEGTVTSDRGSKANVGDNIPIGKGSDGGRFVPSQIGQSVPIGKKAKGSATITSVNTDAGTAGSYGGFKTPQEYLLGGTPKMPNGPMKYGMRSSAPGKHIDGTEKGHEAKETSKKAPLPKSNRQERPKDKPTKRERRNEEMKEELYQRMKERAEAKRKKQDVVPKKKKP